MLDVGVAALADAGEDDFALVGDAVAVGVGQLDEVVGVGLAREDDAVLSGRIMRGATSLSAKTVCLS